MTNWQSKIWIKIVTILVVEFFLFTQVEFAGAVERGENLRKPAYHHTDGSIPEPLQHSPQSQQDTQPSENQTPLSISATTLLRITSICVVLLSLIGLIASNMGLESISQLFPISIVIVLGIILTSAAGYIFRWMRNI